MDTVARISVTIYLYKNIPIERSGSILHFDYNENVSNDKW